MSLSSVDQPGVVLYNQWQEAAVQVDSPTSLLKITVSVFSTLGDAGEEYFRQQASSLLQKPTNFFRDSRNPNRIYLANAADLQQQISCQFEFTGDKYFTLVPAPAAQGTMTTPVHPALGHNTSQGPYLVVNNGLSGPNHFTTNGTSHMQGLNISTPELSSGQLSNRKRKTPEFYAPKGMYEQGWYPTGTPGEAEAQSNNDGRKAKRNKEGKIPRPPNCWILFRAAHHNQVAQNNPGIKNKDISKIISGMWQGMSTAQQEPWRKMADDIRDEHRARHPDYTYKPDTGKTKRRREKKQAQGVQDDIQAVIVPTQQAQAQLDYQQSVPEQVTALAVNEKLEVGQDQVWDHDECQSIPEAVPALAPNETPEAGQDQVWDHDEYQPEDVPFDFSEYVDLDQFDFDI